MSTTSNPYGFFDDTAGEYVITRPDTPLPWLNYLGQDAFFGLCTNTAGGYSFYRDAKLRRITRYRYNNIPMDLGGRYLYLRENGAVWNPGWKPVKADLDHYECRHGTGYTRISGARNGLEASVLFFIPLDENTEIWRVSLRNASSQTKEFQLFSFVEFCFYEALNDMTNFQRTFNIGEVEIEEGAIYHKTEYRERRDHYTLFACTHPVSAWDTSRDAFVGVHNGLHEPQAVFAGQCTNSHAHGWSPIAAHQLDLRLEPGEELSFSFILAYIEQGDLPKFDAPKTLNKAKAQEVLQRYRTTEAVDEAFQRQQARWSDWLGRIQVQTPSPEANRMANVWNQVQTMATFNLSRSASMYESGIGRGMGYRDSNQDLLGFVHMIPDRARERILDIARTQISSGLCFHQYQPLTKRGNADIGGDFYDDHLWLILSTCAYLKETGDKSILYEKIGYADTPDSGHDLLHHLETSIRYTLENRGPHRLPLIGHADWNDCLNLNCFSTEPNESFQTAGDVAGSTAESVMIAGLFLYAAKEMEGLYSHLKQPADAERLGKNYQEMLEAVEEHAWDGEWYRRAYDAEGRPVGSQQCEEGKIYIESQGWCIMGGAGQDNGRARQALESVHEHLFTPHGVILQQPAYSEYHLELGEVSSYPAGYKENAGIFAHNNVWIHIAWTMMGEGDRAFEYYLSINPAAKEDKIDTYRSEPYVYAQMTAGRDAATFGEAKNSWLTGTAAWSFVVISQAILGLKPEYNGLRVSPCIPSSWPEFRATRIYRGTTYEILVKNPQGVCSGVRTVLVNGTEHTAPTLPIAPGERLQVEVILG